MSLSLVLLLALPSVSAPGSDGVRTLHFDVPTTARTPRPDLTPAVAFDELDEHRNDVHHPTPQELPSGWSQSGPDGLGATLGEPDVTFAVEDIPGNQYPRKATLYMNFGGADLQVGADNSAINKSTLAKTGPYPAFTGGQQTAVAAVQEMANDVSAFGINVVYAMRPGPIAPYTMAMVGGDWTDTTLEDGASGVAPGADCGALGQRHVVYVFAGGNWSATAIANVTAQEAGHSWGLDHSVNCGSVMSYCGGGNGSFSNNCDSLCEAGCQGPAGCRLFHEDFCGVGSDRQNEVAELSFLFGGPEPDLVAPTAEIVSPVDGEVYAPGSDVPFRAVVEDNYGGFGWKFVVAKDGEVVYDEVDFDRDVDEQYRAGLNLDGLEVGVYDLGIVAEDQYGNTTVDMVRITVSADGSADDGGSADGGTDGGGADGTTGGASGADGAADDASSDGGGDESGSGLDGATAGEASADDSGCGCRSGSAPTGGMWLAIFAVVGGLRRRRDLVVGA
jgi:MYXO-CTERM domain-containing protein